MSNTDKFIDKLLSEKKEKHAYHEPLKKQNNSTEVESVFDKDKHNDVSSKNNINDKKLESVEEQIVILGDTIKKYRHHLPEQRKPTIIVCGKIGNGKSTTINTIFGKTVSEVGHYSRGTDKDEVYEWEAHTENINIVDLPGLGDSPKNDKVFQEIYRQRVKHADGFIIVVCPPRPAEYGTLKTVKLLIESGISSEHIVFAFNKLSSLRYQDNDKLQQVEIDGLIGPTTHSHVKAISYAKKAFLNDLRREIPEGFFSESQIIEYDSLTGWNLHKMLHAVVEMIPFEALAKLRQVAVEAQNEVKKKEEEHLKRERDLIRKEKENLRQAQSNDSSRETIRTISERLAYLEERTSKREEKIDEESSKREKLEENFFDNWLDGAERIIGNANPVAGIAISTARAFIKEAAPNVREYVNNVSTAIADKTHEVVETVVDTGKKIVKAADNALNSAWKFISSFGKKR